MTYRADPITQRDGSPLANSNCLMAAAATGLDYHTLGRKTSTGAKMRDYSGDTSGGTNTDEIERAWKTGYDEDPATRDGRPWSDVLADLRDGRLVMLQVWHATVGGPCLSGSGAYGHGLAVAPEQHSDGRWLVSDPWCKPPKWSWVSESKLKAGAEEWYSRCRREAGGGPDIRAIVAAARLLMTRHTPDHPAPTDDPPPSAGGGGGVLFASTKPHGGDDVSINANGSRLLSARRVRLGAGQNFYADAELTDQLGEVGSERYVPYVGGANGPAPGVAILLHTSTPYDDGQDRDTVVYVNPEHGGAGDPEENPDYPDTDAPPSDDVTAAVQARDAQWRAWMDAAPGDVMATASAVVSWGELAPDITDPA